MNEEKIIVKLTPAQRKLLLGKVILLDEDIERIVSVALKRGRKYEISMTLDDLDELRGSVAFEANHTKDTALGRKLDTLYKHLDDCLMDAV
jgi:hypothetical protein